MWLPQPRARKRTRNLAPTLNKAVPQRHHHRDGAFAPVVLTDADMEPYLAMAADPEVTRYVSPTSIPRASAEAAATHHRGMLETKGYGYWTIEVKADASFAGIILLQDEKFTAAFTPEIEIGWLLPREHWSNGYATDGGPGNTTNEYVLKPLSGYARLGRGTHPALPATSAHRAQPALAGASPNRSVVERVHGRPTTHMRIRAASWSEGNRCRRE